MSLDEEPHTVNLELNSKIEALDRSNNDLRNLFESTSVATVFLDRHLVIRSYTPAIDSVFHIRPSDRGRPITELASRFILPDFKDEIAAVFDTERTLQRRLSSEDESVHFLVRLSPYRADDREVDGVVIAFVEITSLVRAEQRQQVAAARQHQLPEPDEAA